MVILMCRWFLLGVCLFFKGEAGTAKHARHPFYVSVTEIDYNAKEKTLEVSCKMFTNDFETALNKISGSKVDLSAPKDKVALDKLINNYISNHLKLTVDGKTLTLQFVGSEKEAEATWSYFQVSDIASLKKIDITNTVLYESFEAEINIIHVVVNGNRQSTKLSNPDSHASFTF
jgi:Domain of unknown function (DUF6702)